MISRLHQRQLREGKEARILLRAALTSWSEAEKANLVWTGSAKKGAMNV